MLTAADVSDVEAEEPVAENNTTTAVLHVFWFNPTSGHIHIVALFTLWS